MSRESWALLCERQAREWRIRNSGRRIQPLGCSKELLPVGSRLVNGVERPKAVAEYLLERMIAAGAEQICMVISPEKSDIVRYYAERSYAAEIFYVVQQSPLGLCDALFRGGAAQRAFSYGSGGSGSCPPASPSSSPSRPANRSGRRRRSGSHPG